MDPRSILDTGVGQDPIPTEPLPPGAQQRDRPGVRPGGEPPSMGDMRFPGEDGGKSLAEMAQRDLVATLQLLADRAQYITAATGAAIALRDGELMVCRASAGPSAPEVGAQLQVNSGLSGESVRTKQTLRCDDAATDTRVNRESCEALGIASVVVMPLVRGGEAIGVFELFSDQAYTFEARDITALERMGGMVFTALEQAVAAQGLSPRVQAGPEHPSAPAGEWAGAEPGNGQAAGDFNQAPNLEAGEGGIAFHRRAPAMTPASAPPTAEAKPGSAAKGEVEDVVEVATEFETAPPPARGLAVDEDAVPADSPKELKQADSPWSQDPKLPVGAEDGVVVGIKSEEQVPPATRSAVSNLRKCEGCGFPVSEGRHLCLDCEKKRVRASEAAARSAARTAPAARANVAEPNRPAVLAAPVREQVPLFLSKHQQEPSWLSSHKYMVGAIVVAGAGIVILLFVR